MRRLRPLKFLTGAPSTYVGARLGRPGRTLFKPELLFKGFVIVEGAGTTRGLRGAIPSTNVGGTLVRGPGGGGASRY